MKRILNWLKVFFFPPQDASRLTRVLPYVVLGILTILVLTAGAYAWDYTNSPPFCGETCHTMPPEYTAYLVSPHARVACVECHIGRSFIATQITRKAGDIRHVVFTLFKTYEFPITADQMRPARETCEKCHYPEKFSSDSMEEIRQFGNDVDNSPTSTYLILKTGGGSKREGLGKGIHWHIENKILFYATDKAEQDIPYVRVYKDDGTVDEYVDVESNVDPSSIQEEDLVQVDCITCHNRITHLVLQPEESIDTALQRQLIDPSIPEIRKKGVEALRASYTSEAQALSGIAGLEGYYKAVYPDYYTRNTALILSAISQIQTIYTDSVHIEQKSDWNSHPNNVGHLYSPGCFRCHDGKHLNANQQAIRLECNLCHSIPVVANNQDFVADIEVNRGPEPQSHLNPNWIVLHRQAFDQTCSHCHNTSNPGGTDNTSFCSNSACHGNVWTYAGFDAPALRELIKDQLPPTTPPVEVPTGGPLTYDDTIGPLLTAKCSGCHGENGLQNLNLTTYQGIMKGGDSGPAIVPGDPQNSLLVQKQSGDQPHFAQLSPEELDLVIKWVEANAPEK